MEREQEQGYAQRLASWRAFNYRLSYDIGASIIGAIPKAILNPFEYLASYETKNKKIKWFQKGLRQALAPWQAATEFYLQKPVANIFSLIGFLSGETAGRCFSFFGTAPDYEAPTAKNQYLKPLTPGAFGKFIDMCAPYIVWGAFVGLGYAALVGTAFHAGSLFIQSYESYALLGAAMGMNGFMIRDAMKSVKQNLRENENNNTLQNNNDNNIRLEKEKEDDTPEVTLEDKKKWEEGWFNTPRKSFFPIYQYARVSDENRPNLAKDFDKDGNVLENINNNNNINDINPAVNLDSNPRKTLN